MISVDVVVPCYNYSRFLPQSVESALSQEGVSVRVLIIDDCSSDDSEVVGRTLAAKDSRVYFRRHEANCGHIATYNEGLLGWTTAEFSILLSADDMLAPGALCRATNLMVRHPEVGMTYGMAINFTDDEELTLRNNYLSNDYQILAGGQFLNHCFEVGNCVPTPTAVVRTELQKRLGGYRSDLPHSGDMEMWMRFAANSSVGVIRDVQAYYRRHNSNMTHQYANHLFGDRREIIQACEHVYLQWGNRFPDSECWMGKTFFRISEESCWLANQAFEAGDIQTYRTFLEFAEHVYPKIRYSPCWLKARVKGFIGHAFWQRISPVWDKYREIRGSARENTPLNSERDRLSGWWPDPMQVEDLTAGVSNRSNRLKG